MALDLAKSFRNGVHPDEHKERTEHLPTERMPFVDRYVLPLAQHLGAPSKPVVKVGELVTRGQLLAEPGGFVSTSLHSPVTGKVVAFGKRRLPNGTMGDAFEIEADLWATQRAELPLPTPWTELSREAFVKEVQRAGLVGMGGAAFPSHVKYAEQKGKPCEVLILNGCECEPYLTCDHRTMVERAGAVIRGVEIAMTQLGAKRAAIGVELNKPDAIEALRGAVRPGLPIEVLGLEVKYPQGAEKMLINALFGQKVPAGGLPLDLGMVVNNVGTAAALADYFERGLPLIERLVTVSGPGVTRPANLLVPIGTPVREVLRHCGGLTAQTQMVVMGGPMMGTPLASVDVPVLKGTSGILAFTEQEVGRPEEYPCIRCGRCLEACANFLNPSRLARLARAGMYEEMEPYYVNDCMECGGCTFACPSGIPIVQLIRTAKAALRERKKS
jgi:Na+-translocating ferredoxin:NAD+ oxidoreductase subunit C